MTVRMNTGVHFRAVPATNAAEQDQLSRQTSGLPEYWAVIIAGLFSAFFLTTALYISAHRMLWYDEILTDLVSRQPWPRGVFHLLKMGVDQQPLPYYFFVKLSKQAFGANAFGLRVPSAVTLFVGLLITFDCARRLTNGWYGLLALAFLSCTCLPYYGVEARPYALVFMWTIAALWLWLHTPVRSGIAALLFGVSIFGTVTSHYYGVFCLVPFGLSALLKIRAEALPPKLVAGTAGAIAGLATMFPMIHALHGGLHGLKESFWAPATPGALEEAFTGLFPHFSILLSLILVWVVICTVYRASPIAVPMDEAERLAWLFLAMPFAGFAAARLVTNALYHRYFIGMLPGVAVAFACLMWRHSRSRTIIWTGILCLLATFGLALYTAHIRNPDWDDPTAPGESARLRELLAMEKAPPSNSKRFLMLPLDSMLAVEILYHSGHPDRYRLLNDPTSLIPIYCRMNQMIGQFLPAPMQLWNLTDVKAHAHEIAMIEPPQRTIFALQKMGLTFQFQHVHALQRVMYLEKSAF